MGLVGLIVASRWLDLVGLANEGFEDKVKHGETVVGSVSGFGE